MKNCIKIVSVSQRAQLLFIAVNEILYKSLYVYDNIYIMRQLIIINHSISKGIHNDLKQRPCENGNGKIETSCLIWNITITTMAASCSLVCCGEESDSEKAVIGDYV